MKNKKNILIIVLIVIYFLFLRTKSFTVTFDTDGSTCTREVTTSVNKKTSCPSGYSSKSGKCVNYKTKYHALSISTSPFWKCNSSSDYMYSEVDGVGGAYMWCVKTTSKVTTEFCPSGYTKENDTCKKIETINCTLSK